jgi:hypothetical protein
VLGQGNIGGGLLDIHYKEQHQKCLYRLATARLRNIDTLRRLHLCARATTAQPPRGIAKGVLTRGCSRVIPPKMESLLYAILVSLLRNRFVSPLLIRQTATRASRFFSLLLPLRTATFSTIMAKRKATAEELEARAESNGYKRGAHREKDSTRDNGKHNKKAKRNQNSVLNRYVL